MPRHWRVALHACIGRECRTCPNPGAVTPFPSHSYFWLYNLLSFSLLRHYSISKSIEFVNFVNCFRCLEINSCLFFGQLPCFDVSLFSVSHIILYIVLYIILCYISFGGLHLASIIALTALLIGLLVRKSGIPTQNFAPYIVIEYFPLSSPPTPRHKNCEVNSLPAFLLRGW